MKDLQTRHQRKRPAWSELTARFVADRECLAAFMALESAEVIEGEKPANLLNIRNWKRPCGRNMYELWKRYGRETFDQSALDFKELAVRDDAILLLIFNRTRLSDLLSQGSATAILRKAGYPCPTTVETALTELTRRMDGAKFPHEVGLFLGYPLKDVVGFMGWAPLHFSCQGPWKIYGDSEKSLSLAQRFFDCRCRMASYLSFATDPSTIFKAKTA